MRSLHRGYLLASALTSLCTWTGHAGAHGGFPRAFSILVDPGDPADILLRSDVWGFFRSRDAGKTWSYGCSELYGVNSSKSEHVNFLLMPGGRTLVASSFSGLAVGTDACNWHPSPSFSRALPDGGSANELVADVGARGSDYFVLTATGSNGGINGKVWRTADLGETWTPIGTPLPADFADTSIGLPPKGAPSRIYVAGVHINSSDALVERSDDDGKTWSGAALPTKDFDHSPTLRISLVHPDNPDVFIVWVDSEEGYGQDSPDELWVTRDGGKTFALLFASEGDLPGLALSPDGTELLVAGPRAGIMAAQFDEALESGPTAFRQRSTGCDPAPCQIWGLAWTSQGLYAGTNEFSGGDGPQFTLGLSKDGGATFARVMGTCDVELDATCGTETATARTCSGSVWEYGYAYDYANADRCSAAGGAASASSVSGGGTAGSGATTAVAGAGGAPASPGGASVGGANTGSRGGGSCGVSPGGPRASLAALCAGLLGVALRRRRRTQL
jgi:hypothetical protein